MKIKKSENLTSEQQEVVRALDKLYVTIRECGKFSQSDISDIMSDVKSLNKLYEGAFGRGAFSWQVDYYTVQMALENKYQFIFSGGDKMTWTRTRWSFALITELAIYHYKCTGNVEMAQEFYGFQIMCLWLFFQYFKAEAFSGAQCEEVLNISFEIVKDAESAIMTAKDAIKQWRIDNNGNIEDMKYYKKKWSQELGRMKRLVYGRMKVKEVEWYHIVYWCIPEWSFEDNMLRLSKFLGVSVTGLKKRIRQFRSTSRFENIDETNFTGYAIVNKEEAETLYNEEYKWAEKVISNTLSKKDRKKFWRKFTIPNPHRLFRTFTFSEEDLIPASNPLLTSDERPNREVNSLNVNNMFQTLWDPMRSPLKSSLNLPGMMGYASPFDSPDLFKL